MRKYEGTITKNKSNGVNTMKNRADIITIRLLTDTLDFIGGSQDGSWYWLGQQCRVVGDKITNPNIAQRAVDLDFALNYKLLKNLRREYV